MININEITWAIIGLFVVATVILIILARKERKISRLKSENKHLRTGFDAMTQIIRTSNATGRIPKELEDEDLEE